MLTTQSLYIYTKVIETDYLDLCALWIVMSERALHFLQLLFQLSTKLVNYPFCEGYNPQQILNVLFCLGSELRKVLHKSGM